MTYFEKSYNFKEIKNGDGFLNMFFPEKNHSNWFVMWTKIWRIPAALNSAQMIARLDRFISNKLISFFIKQCNLTRNQMSYPRPYLYALNCKAFLSNNMDSCNWGFIYLVRASDKTSSFFTPTKEEYKNKLNWTGTFWGPVKQLPLKFCIARRSIKSHCKLAV